MLKLRKMLLGLYIKFEINNVPKMMSCVVLRVETAKFWWLQWFSTFGYSTDLSHLYTLYVYNPPINFCAILLDTVRLVVWTSRNNPCRQYFRRWKNKAGEKIGVQCVRLAELRALNVGVRSTMGKKIWSKRIVYLYDVLENPSRVITRLIYRIDPRMMY